NTRAQQNYLQLLMGAEAERRAATMEILKSTVQYKEKWNLVFAERARTGTTGPEPLPHPDDLVIDMDTGEVNYDGPVLSEQKAAQDWLISKRRELVDDLKRSNE